MKSPFALEYESDDDELSNHIIMNAFFSDRFVFEIAFSADLVVHVVRAHACVPAARILAIHTEAHSEFIFCAFARARGAPAVKEPLFLAAGASRARANAQKISLE